MRKQMHFAATAGAGFAKSIRSCDGDTVPVNTPACRVPSAISHSEASDRRWSRASSRRSTATRDQLIPLSRTPVAYGQQEPPCQKDENSGRSPNGDSWFLGREPATGHAFIIHQPNAPSGGRMSHIELGEFLRDEKGPNKSIIRLICHFGRGAKKAPRGPRDAAQICSIPKRSRWPAWLMILPSPVYKTGDCRKSCAR